MMDDVQSVQVEQNYDAFQRVLARILPEHRDQFALMRDREIVAYYPSAGDANRAGLSAFPDEIFSIQEVTDIAVDLGFYSHVHAS